MAALEKDEQSILIDKRYTLLRNIKNLSENEKEDWAKMRNTYRELGEMCMSMRKECLHNIYWTAKTAEEPISDFVYWCKLSVEIGIKDYGQNDHAEI